MSGNVGIGILLGCILVVLAGVVLGYLSAARWAAFAITLAVISVVLQVFVAVACAVGSTSNACT